jgi:hypothetical protein
LLNIACPANYYAAMTAPPPPPPVGWYSDPSGSGKQRYWDGRTWTHFESHAPQHDRPKWLVPVLIVAAVLAIILSSIGGNDTEGDSAATSATTSASVRPTPAGEPTLRPTPTVAPPGSAVRDGKFEFQVLAVTSANTVGDGYLIATAQGVFVIFTLSVRNIGDEPRSYSGQNQKLIDMSGREYQVSSDADPYMNSYGLVDDINPGNAIEVKVPFDVQPDTQMSMLELHDSMFSAGVRVAAPPGP